MIDTCLTRPGAANIQFGTVNTTGATAPTAQTISFQSTAGGTGAGAVNGANTTIIGSLSAGTGTSGDIIFQTGVKPNSGTAQATATTALTIKGETGAAIVAGTISATLAVLGQANLPCYNSGTGLFTYTILATACVVSDGDAKNNFKPIDPEYALRVVICAVPGTFTYKPERNLGNDLHVGEIAQQMEKCAPELVTRDPVDGHADAIKQLELSPYLFGAIKALSRRLADNDNLRAEVEALRRSIAP
jgi:hypothetical protein